MVQMNVADRLETTITATIDNMIIFNIVASDFHGEYPQIFLGQIARSCLLRDRINLVLLVIQLSFFVKLGEQEFRNRSIPQMAGWSDRITSRGYLILYRGTR